MVLQNVLHIPTFFSVDEENTVGFKIKQQIEQYEGNNIILFIEAKSENKIIKINIDVKNNFSVIHISHPVGTNYFSRTRNYLNSVTTGLSKVIDMGFKIDKVVCYDARKNIGIANRYFDYIPRHLVEINNQFLNQEFHKLSNRKQKNILKNINKLDNVFVTNKEVKNILIHKGINIPITILKNKPL